MRPALRRVPLLLLGFIALFVAAGAGLARLAWPMPDLAQSASGLHGPLMICGFFGVVIGLERAVALGWRIAYLGPLLSGAGTVLALAGRVSIASVCYVSAAAILLLASLQTVRRQPAAFTVTMALGAGAWLVATIAWAIGAALPAVLPGWLAFLVLTIAGERLELSRLLPPSDHARSVFVVIVAAVLLGAAGAATPWGWPVFSAALLALAGWLLRQDIARRTVRGLGLSRYIAVCLLSGYAWLAVGAAIALGAASPPAPGSAPYDAALHAMLLGFVFSMVFGHAPIIFPAVLRVKLPYSPAFYGPLALLHGSLILRLAGDATDRFDWLRAGGLLNAVTLVVFVLGMIAAVLRGRRGAGNREVRGA